MRTSVVVVVMTAVMSAFTTPPAAAGPESSSPVGYLDSVTPAQLSDLYPRISNLVDAAGWAFDPDALSQDTQILVEDTAPSGTLTTHVRRTGAARPDVGTAFPGVGDHRGFTVTVALTREPGVHQLCLRALNLNSGADATIGCRPVAVADGLPFGSVDAIDYPRAGELVVAGWIAHPVDPRDQTGLVVSLRSPIWPYVRGQETSAGRSRPDVAAAYPGYGERHGFDRVSFAINGGGDYTACASAYPSTRSDQPWGAAACRTISIPDVIGAIDVVTLDADRILTIEGWTLDPAHPDQFPDVTGLRPVSGSVAVLERSSTPRPDVAAAFGAGVGHGFVWKDDASVVAVGTPICLTADVGVAVRGFSCVTV